MRMAWREKYACGVISPAKVINTVENKKAVSPVITELDSRVNKTLIPTLPQRIVVKRKFTSLRKVRIFTAAGLPACFNLQSQATDTQQGQVQTAEHRRLTDTEQHTHSHHKI